MKRLLLADDDATVRGLVRELLTARTGWEVCAEASNGVEAVELAKAFAPDIALLDIAMPHRNGLQAAREIVERHYATAVMLLTMYDPLMIFSQTADAGIRGIVSKTCIGAELIPAVEAVLNGQTFFPVTPKPEAH